jgi:hypothetical protein
VGLVPKTVIRLQLHRHTSTLLSETNGQTKGGKCRNVSVIGTQFYWYSNIMPEKSAMNQILFDLKERIPNVTLRLIEYLALNQTYIPGDSILPLIYFGICCMTIKKKKYKQTLVRKRIYFEIHLLEVARAERFRWILIGQYCTCLCRQYPNQLWFVMISDAGRLLNYEKGRKYVWSEVICNSVWMWKWTRVGPCNSL